MATVGWLQCISAYSQQSAGCPVHAQLGPHAVGVGIHHRSCKHDRALSWPSCCAVQPSPALVPDVLQAMGDKTAARRAAIECGVPIVPGTNQALLNAEEALKFAEEAGYPVILKAAMGGGGRGMRVVRNGEIPVMGVGCRHVSLTAIG